MASEAEIQSRIDALESALASGVTTVSHNGTTTTYRSFVEMQRTLTWLKGEKLKAAGSTTRKRLRYGKQGGKGL